jgi:hypothetical protein
MKVELMSNAEMAAESTDRTIRALPGGAFLKRDADGKIEFDEQGLATVENASGFTEFALVNQGYVRRVVA